jgi:hypothetical protein
MRISGLSDGRVWLLPKGGGWLGSVFGPRSMSRVRRGPRTDPANRGVPCRSGSFASPFLRRIIGVGIIHAAEIFRQDAWEVAGSVQDAQDLDPARDGPVEDEVFLKRARRG